MKQNKVLGMLGLAKRAGKVVSGEFSVEKAVKAKQAYLVLVAEDASDNTKKNFRDMCSYYDTRLIMIGTKEDLGKSVGCQFRASVAVTDPGFSKAILDKIGEQA